MSGEVSFTIDGARVAASLGTTVLEAALKAGIHIPHICHDPRLVPTGACRLCVVEIEGERGLQTACSRIAKEGMVVRQDTPRIRTSRKTTLELLLSEHNVVCTTCDKDGACLLQDYAYEYQASENRFPNVMIPPGRNNYTTGDVAIEYDPSKCVRCQRCVRVCAEIPMAEALTLRGRGSSVEVTTGFDVELEKSSCVSCGACVNTCPTGALYDRQAKGLGRAKDLEKVRTTCPYCGVGCQMDLNVNRKLNRLVRVTSEPGVVPNDGHLCVKGKYGLDFAGHADRLSTPLIRRNGKLEETTWEEALDFAAARLKETLQKSGPGAIGCFSSAKATNEENFAMMRFARAVLGTNNVDHCARLCHSSTVAGLAATMGSGAMTNSMAEPLKSDVIFVTGSNTTWTHPVFGDRIRQAVKYHGVRLIVADPREIDLAKCADVHMRQKNGTDVPMLMGMQRIIVSEGWHNARYIEERCENWEEYRKSLEFFTPEKVEELTGIPPKTLYEAAKLYATGGRAAIYFSMGITQHSHGVDNVKACCNLAMITGNIGFEGCGINPLRGQNNVQGACDMGALPNVFSGYQPVTDAAVRRKFAERWNIAPEKMDAAVGGTVTTMIADCGDAIKAVYIMGENPMLSEPNLNHVESQLKKLDLLIVQDIFLTETALLADVVLPGVSSLEKLGSYTNTERRVQLVRPALKPPVGARNDYEIIADIAKRLGADNFPRTPDELWKEVRDMTPSYRGIARERIEKEGIQWPCPSEDHPGTPILHVGKFTRGKGILTPLKYVPPAEEPDNEYPMRLSTGRILAHYHTCTMTRRSKVLDKRVPHGTAEIHPSDAAKHGIKNGDKVKVVTRRGVIETHAEVTKRVAAGSLFISFHFVEAAANRLTNDALDPVAKIPEYKMCAARLERAC